MPFPYKKNNEVSWNYTCQVFPNSSHDSTVTMLDRALTSFVTNVFEVKGITYSGHCYSPKELERWRVEELERQRKRKEKEVMEEIIVEEGCKEPKAYKRNVLEDEAYEFLKFIKQSDYKVIEQLNHTPA